jgi:hypothetical protein
MKLRCFKIVAALCFALCLARPAHADNDDVLRLAVVVGANAAPAGRSALRYAHDDAKATAEVLLQTGGFAKENIILLTEPQPQAVVDSLERLLAKAATKKSGQSLLFFYYSGHADPDALYPSGKSLSVSRLRTLMRDGRADLRMGIIDACRGGGWTGSKGLTPAEPFEVDLPSVLASEGVVLISSSSGQQNAHESEMLGGSFFTHHWNAALRGAADRNDDGLVTINEAFAYAREMTVRDTARFANEPQRPSYSMDVKGRDDLVISSLDRRRALLLLHQAKGPLQLIDLRAGTVILETKPGAQRLRLALPVGRYLVRKRSNETVWSKEIAIAHQGNTSVEESQLARDPGDALANKSVEAATGGIVPVGQYNLQLALGVRHAPVIDPGLRLVTGSAGIAALFRIVYGFAPRWHVAFPFALAYGGGEAERLEWFSWFGVPVLGFTDAEKHGFAVNTLLGAGIDSLWHCGAWCESLNASVGVLGAAQYTNDSAGRSLLDTWTAVSTLGSSWSFRNIAALNLGVAVAKSADLEKQSITNDFLTRDGLVLAIGSVQRRALRPLPLVRVYLLPSFAVEGHVTLSYAILSHTVQETYLMGFWADM